MALNYLNKANFSSREFFIKRFARLYPVYVLAFFLTLILGMIFNGAFPKGGSALLQLFSLHAWVPGISLEINYPSWSIAVEVFLYLTLPLILILEKRIGSVKINIIIVSFWLLSSLQHILFLEFLFDSNNSQIRQFILYFPLWHLNAFLTGILCAKYIKLKIKQNNTNYLQPRILYVLGIMAFFVLLGTHNGIKQYTHNGLMAPVFFLIIAGLSTDRSLVTRIFSKKIFVLLGDASYSIYLFQFPIAIILMAILGSDKLDGFHFYIYMVSLVLFSIAIYNGFEKKMRKIIVSKMVKLSKSKTKFH